MSSHPTQAHGRPRGPALWLAAAAILGAGACFRLFHYLLQRSLWLDEAMLALNIAARGYRELLRPLDHTQAAPVLFLWIERFCAEAFGVNELALRAFPLAAGLALVAVLGALGERLLGRAGALAALALGALSPTLIRYANELKPYGSDALATALVLAAAIGVLDEPASRRRSWLFLGAGWCAVLLSFPALFVAGGALLALLLDVRVRRAQPVWLAACAICWTGTVAVLYAMIYGAPATSAEQQQGYARAFLGPGPDLPQRIWLAFCGTVLPTFTGSGSAIPTLEPLQAGLIGGLLMMGLVLLARRRGVAIAVLVAAPLALCVAASCLRRYPLGVPRLMVFGSPLLILLAASTAAWFYERLRAYARLPLLGALGLLAVVPTLRSDIEGVRNPYRGEDARALVEAYRRQRQGVEVVYVSVPGMASWLLYTTNWQKPDRERLDVYARAGREPVERPDFDRIVRRRGHVELLGLPAGVQWSWPDYVKRDPAPGWAASEARRIFSAVRENPTRNRCAWLYFTHLSDAPARPVTWSLRDGYGAVRRDWIGASGGALYRYCFPEERLGRSPKP